MKIILKSALIGCGGRAIEHASAYEHIADAAIWAICDPDAKRLSAFPGQIPDDRRHSSVASLLANCIPDIAHLITPPTVRLAIISQLVAAGVKTIVVEKPLACTLTEAQQIVTLCEQQGVLLVVNHQFRYAGSYQQARQFLTDGLIGNIERVRLSCNGTPYEQGTHMVDFADFLLGGLRPQRLFGQVSGAAKLTASHPSSEWMIGRIQCEGDIPIDLVFGDISEPHVVPEEFWVACQIEVFGSKGVVRHRLSSGYRVIAENSPVLVSPAYSWGEENLYSQVGLMRQVIDAMHNRGTLPAILHGAGALLPIALLEGLTASALCREAIDWPVQAVPDLPSRLREVLGA